MSFEAYESHDAVALAELVRGGQVAPVELVEAAIRRIEQRNPTLNAVIHRLYDTARAAAVDPPEGPFRGVPMLVKDLGAEVAGAPMQNGSRIGVGVVPDRDNELVSRYRSAGFLFVGKTNTPELGITPTTEPALHGPTRNPWNTERTSGGSSGGSAAAVAAGMVPVAHGGDGGGSIRIPASCCGLFGMKPTRGRNPMGPFRGPSWQGAVVEHVLSRSVRDSAAVLDASHGPDAGAPYHAPPPERPWLQEVGRDPGRLRIGWTSRPFLADAVHPECAAAVQDTARLLEGLGHHVEETAPDLDRGAFSRAFVTVIASEIAADVTEAESRLGRPARWEELETTTWPLVLLGRTLRAAELASAARALHRESLKVGTFFTRYDVLLTPTLGSPPVPLGAIRATGAEAAMTRIVRSLHAGRLLQAVDAVGQMAARAFDFAAFTPVFNVTGQPAMSVPLYWTSDGLPVGLQFVGPFGDEALLFRLAGQLEVTRPWFDRRPPVADA